MTPEFPSRLSMIGRIRYSADALLEFDISTGGLRVKKWPIDGRAQRIHVDNLVQYRATHFFQNPCCLCAIPGGQNVVEAAIIVASDGELCNTWVATCASDACGYLDTEVKFFLRRVAVARRDIQPPVVHVSEMNCTPRAIGSREACAVMTRRVFGIHQCARPAEPQQTEEFPDDNTLFFHMDEI
ncbi:hypothetical protein FIBSPDRAFT_904069 [Athelia psychrophila]|uniref:Uncharacterized protein n=1 Tax=Athelia psychrophila TaxID=1759441 RepID=A0A167UM75_9AGAM|nr:hypothetical protein FIBSPDRAFT_904536 [Fibularhizoctonia sp. CBS 109695]KZP04718.1 hypothetical protein FIBSPDRAFT_904069 [Fibularhizoctonia sp. CBS 109695]